MKKTTFEFRFTTEEGKTEVIRLPKNYQHNLSVMTQVESGDNSCYTLSVFCEEYAELTKKEKKKFQQIIDSNILKGKLKTFYDLRVLVATLDDFIVTETKNGVQKVTLNLPHRMQNIND